MNFWSFLTRPGDKHDAEKIMLFDSQAKLVQARDSAESHGFWWNIILKWNVSFFNKNGNVYCCWIVSDSPHVNAENRKLQETSRRFCEILVGHMFFKGDEIS